MKKFFKFFFVLFSLVLRGGVGTAFAANVAETVAGDDVTTYADKTVYEFTVNVLREAKPYESTTMTYYHQHPVMDFSDAAEIFGTVPTVDMVRLVKNGVVLDNPTYQESNNFSYDGWFNANGEPNAWGATNQICVKFFEALLNNGKYQICDMFTENEIESFKNIEVKTVKWALVHDDKTIIYTFNIIFYKNDYQYKYTFTENYYPKLWESLGTNDVIQMYMGGWKYQDATNSIATINNTNNEYITNNSAQSQLAGVYPSNHLSSSYKNNSKEYGNEIGDGKETTDYWEKTSQDTDYAELDGEENANNYKYYQYYFPGYEQKSFGKGDNARSEFVERDVAGKYGQNFNGFRKGNPFAAPCFGAFLKFEPEQNGTVALYIIQNGIVDLSESNGGASQLNTQVSWRPTYIVDELGNLLTDEGANGVTVELPIIRINYNESNVKDGATVDSDLKGQKIYIGWDGSYTAWSKGNLPNSKDADQISEFLKNVSSKIQNNLSTEQWDKLKEYWTTGGTEMRMMPPRDSQDGWVAINKAYVKYTFPVKAGKSYYVFNNDSKIGFSGYVFISDENTNYKNEKKKAALTISDDGTYSIEGGENGNDINNIPAGTYESVTINRSFKQGWNAICLPFSVTESKMREWFGSDGKTEDYELVTYNGCKLTPAGEIGTKDGLTAHFFRHAYQDILAGYPYMLYIPAKAKALDPKTYGYVKFDDITIENEVKMATFQSSHDYMEKGSSRYGLAPEGDYKYIGTFKPISVPAGSYAVYGIGSNSKEPTNTGIRYVENETNMNGLRAYLHPAYRDLKPTAEIVARIVGTNFSDVIDDSMWDDATVINDLMEEMGFFDQREHVYSITGQIVRQNTTSLIGLPKGVYIVKGKKYLVK